MLAQLSVPFIGCYYSYSDIEVGQSVVKKGGVEMTRTSADLAVVKWGETVYIPSL